MLIIPCYSKKIQWIMEINRWSSTNHIVITRGNPQSNNCVSAIVMSRTFIGSVKVVQKAVSLVPNCHGWVSWLRQLKFHDSATFILIVMHTRMHVLCMHDCM